MGSEHSTRGLREAPFLEVGEQNPFPTLATALGSLLTFVFSVFDETQRAKALVFWSPKIHAASFPALACHWPVPWSPCCLGEAARGGVVSSSVARVRGETLDELRGVRLGALVTGRRDAGRGLCCSPFEASTTDPIKCPGDILEAGLALPRI